MRDKPRKSKVHLEDWYKPTKGGEKARRALGVDDASLNQRRNHKPKPA